MLRYAGLSLAVLFACALQAQAGEKISATSLKAVGLSNLQSMTQVEGLAIRAKGLVWGQSTATAATAAVITTGNVVIVSGASATSTNGYVGSHFGANVSGATASNGITSTSALSGGFSATF